MQKLKPVGKWLLLLAVLITLFLAAFMLNFGSPPMPEPSPQRAIFREGLLLPAQHSLLLPDEVAIFTYRCQV